MDKLSDPNIQLINLLNESIDRMKFSDVDLISRINSVISKIRDGELVVSEIRMSKKSNKLSKNHISVKSN